MAGFADMCCVSSVCTSRVLYYFLKIMRSIRCCICDIAFAANITRMQNISGIDTSSVHHCIVLMMTCGRCCLFVKIAALCADFKHQAALSASRLTDCLRLVCMPGCLNIVFLFKTSASVALPSLVSQFRASRFHGFDVSVIMLVNRLLIIRIVILAVIS